jgi:hypothetical protein
MTHVIVFFPLADAENYSLEYANVLAFDAINERDAIRQFIEYGIYQETPGGGPVQTFLHIIALRNRHTLLGQDLYNHHLNDLLRYDVPEMYEFFNRNFENYIDLLDRLYLSNSEPFKTWFKVTPLQNATVIHPKEPEYD